MQRKKTADHGSPTQGSPDKTSGDGVLKDLAAKAAKLAPALAAESSGDPRRRGDIRVLKGLFLHCLNIEGKTWVEIEWSEARKAWCIQDCMEQCLTHLHAEVPNGPNGMYDPSLAIKKAKEMIRNGSMPSPEDARAAFAKRHGY